MFVVSHSNRVNLRKQRGSKFHLSLITLPCELFYLFNFFFYCLIRSLVILFSSFVSRIKGGTSEAREINRMPNDASFVSGQMSRQSVRRSGAQTRALNIQITRSLSVGGGHQLCAFCIRHEKFSGVTMTTARQAIGANQSGQKPREMRLDV